MTSRFTIGRRAMLQAMGLGAAAAAAGAQEEVLEAAPIFQHGVASGDPLSDRVILWTRVSVDAADAPIPVTWEVSETDTFDALVAEGKGTASAARDYTVKIDVSGLKPGKRYVYRFKALDQVSPVGHTMTLPVGDVESMTIASCSCSNYPYGFFHVYRQIAANADIDIVLHLGDYIYEYAKGTYSDPSVEAKGRIADPETEILTLQDYRKRYALYRSDPDLQAAHQAHPFVAIWDDHEISNNTWSAGAENHQPGTEGLFEERRDAALKAYDEWMPTRADMRRPWRSIDLGDLARLVVLDTRLWGRDKQLNYATDFDPRTIAVDVSDQDNPKPLRTPDAQATMAATKVERLAVPFDMREKPPKPLLDLDVIRTFDPKDAPPYLTYLPDVGGFKEKLEEPARTLLGEEQEAWLGPQLEGSKKRGQPWQILAQQVLMAKVFIPKDVGTYASDEDNALSESLRAVAQLVPFGLPLNMDAWDGYPAARQRLFDQARQFAKNLIVLAGDTHNSWVSQLTDKRGPVGWEVATPSVSSPGFEGYLPIAPETVEAGLKDASPDVKYMNAKDRGYVTIRLTREEAIARYHYVSTVKSRDFDAKDGPVFRVVPGGAPDETTLEPVV